EFGAADDAVAQGAAEAAAFAFLGRARGLAHGRPLTTGPGSVVGPVVLDLFAGQLEADVDDVVAAVLPGRQGDNLADLLQARHAGAVAGEGDGDVEVLARQHRLVGLRDG